MHEVASHFWGASFEGPFTLCSFGVLCHTLMFCTKAAQAQESTKYRHAVFFTILHFTMHGNVLPVVYGMLQWACIGAALPW